MPVNNPPRVVDYDNAHEDLQTVEDVTNGPAGATVTSRLGRTIQTLAGAIASIVDGTAFAVKNGTNTFTDTQSIAIPGTSADKKLFNHTLGSLSVPMGPYSSSFGYSGATLQAFIEPRAPTGGEPNADGLYSAVSINSTFVGGSRGINCAMYVESRNIGHSGGGSFESGQCSIFISAFTDTDDTAFSIAGHTNITASAGGLGRVCEWDFIATGATILERIGQVVVSVNTDVAVVNSSVTMPGGGATVPISFANEVVTIGSGEGFDYAFAAVTANGGAEAVNRGVVFGSGSPLYGLDFRYLTPTQSAVALANAAKIEARNFAGNAMIDIARLGTDNRVVLGPSDAVTIATDKHVRMTGAYSLIGTEGMAHRKADGSNVAIFGLRPDLNGGNDDIVLWPAISTAFRVGMELQPLANNTNDLGGASRRWKTVWLQNAPDVVSDARLKTDFEALSPAILRAGRRLAERSILSWTWKSDPGGKRQVGPTVQDVIAAFESEGLDPLDWAMIGIHPVMETVETDEPVMTEELVARECVERVPRHVTKQRNAVHWDDQTEARARNQEWVALVRHLGMLKKSGVEVPELRDGSPPDESGVSAAAARLTAEGHKLPPDPWADGWRPRIVVEDYQEEVATIYEEEDEDGNPVWEEVAETDEAGRLKVENGETCYTRRKKIRREVVYDEIPTTVEELVPVQMRKPDGSLVWRSVERPVMDPETGEPAVEYSLNHDQLQYLMIAALAE